VQDAHDIDTVSHFSEIDDVTLYIAASVAQPDVVAGCRSVWRFGQFFESSAQFVGVSVGLVDAPFLSRCKPNLLKVALAVGARRYLAMRQLHPSLEGFGVE
jgi:hypothetical protein